MRCVCGWRVRSAEDHRNHFPCPESPKSQEFRRGEVFALKQVIAHLRGRWDDAATLIELLCDEKETNEYL